MILQVPFEQFATTVKRVLKIDEAFVTPKGLGALATAAVPERDLIVVSLASSSVEDTKRALSEAELKPFDGCWHTEETLETDTGIGTPYVAAVSYVSQENTPGLWVDAFETLPNHVMVLRALYEEFRETGQVGEVTFEEFIRLAQPNVVVATPEQLHGYVSGKC